MHPHDTLALTLSRARASRQACEVCQSFTPDETGRCPLCAPETHGRSGDVVHDLMVHRDGAA